ncbi:MAG: hypothetical protein CMD18_05870 [Flavobacteriales bacterium]|nr:hypothetical protein [Flavobacteriales bacterium]
MIKHFFAKIILLISFLFAFICVQSQDDFASKEVKPSLGLGIGVFNYFGDVNSIGNHTSLLNQFGYEFHVARKLSNYSDLGFSFLTGTIIGNERSIERNLNFRTDIYSISVYGSFNLDYLLNFSDVINPYITIGFESFEYNNKGDLVDANGSLYHYWNDGTIRTISQNSPYSNQADLMQRDYRYETDLRAANLDGFGKYPQLAIAIPIGFGVNLNVSDRLSFKVNSTFHYTFTDLIDNVSKNGSGTRKGNKINDYFTFNSVSLHYDFLSSSSNKTSEGFAFPDYFNLDVDDEDGDGVFDGIDICPFTPPGVDVDQDGCPLDDDQDGVPNYRDKERLTSEESYVNAQGEALGNDEIYHQYLQYVDSIDVPIEVLYRIAGEPEKAGSYRILLGEFSGEISERLAEIFIAEGDVIGILNRKGKTAYLTQKYGNISTAEERRDQLLEKGFPQATIVVWDKNDYFTLNEWDLLAKNELRNRFKNFYQNKEKLEGMYALKLGEISVDAMAQDKAKFFEYEDVVVLKADSGKSDFVIGPFINKVEAKQYLQEVDRDKYPDAEVITVIKGKSKSAGIAVQDIEPIRPVGPDNWNKNRKQPKENESRLLDKLEGSLVIDFGKILDLQTNNTIHKIKSQVEVAEIKDTSGTITIITKKPQSDSYVKTIVDNFQIQGVQAKIKRVQDGQLIPVDLSELVQEEQIDENPIPKTDSLFAQINTDSLAQVNANTTKSASSELYGKWQDVLSKVNGSFVIDFGKSDNQKIEKIQKELEEDMDIVEVMTINGENKLITPQAQDKVNAERIIKKLESKGIEAILVQVKDGELIPARSIEELKSNEQPTDIELKDKYDDFENNYVVKIGTIDDKTTLAERGKLINAPQSIQILKSNGTIDVISKSISENEEDAYQNKADHISAGFDSSKVAYFKDGKVEVIRKEELEGKYTVSMGSFKTNVTNDQVNNILSLPDIESIETHNPEMTTYVLGTYDSPEDAKKRVEDLVKKGLNPAIVKIKNGKIKELELNVVFDDIGIKNLTMLKENAKQVKTDEVVFRVQLGAYRSKIDMNIFQGVNTLSFPTSGGVTKYVTGSFITYQQAYIHKIDMRRMGFSGSFVVAYKDGKRIKVTDLVNQEKYKKVKESVSPIEKELDKINDSTLSMDSKSVENPEVSFKVQIGSYKGDEMADKLAQFPNLEMEIYGKYKRYISGDFQTYLEADNHKKEIAEKGFGEACVVAYNDGQRVETPGSESNVITQDDLTNKVDKPTDSPVIPAYQLSKVSIMVQVGLFRGEIPAELSERYSALPDLTKQVTNYGVIRYMTGDFKNTSEAAAYKEELIKTGFPDAFLVAYYANQRVTMQEIVQIIKKAK